jgi:hypothetical protein
MDCGSWAHAARPPKITTTPDLAKPFPTVFDQHMGAFSNNPNSHFLVITTLMQRMSATVANRTNPTPNGG